MIRRLLKLLRSRPTRYQLKESEDFKVGKIPYEVNRRGDLFPFAVSSPPSGGSGPTVSPKSLPSSVAKPIAPTMTATAATSSPLAPFQSSSLAAPPASTKQGLFSLKTTSTTMTQPPQPQPPQWGLGSSSSNPPQSQATPLAFGLGSQTASLWARKEQQMTAPVGMQPPPLVKSFSPPVAASTATIATTTTTTTTFVPTSSGTSSFSLSSQLLGRVSTASSSSAPPSLGSFNLKTVALTTPTPSQGDDHKDEIQRLPLFSSLKTPATTLMSKPPPPATSLSLTAGQSLSTMAASSSSSSSPLFSLNSQATVSGPASLTNPIAAHESEAGTRSPFLVPSTSGPPMTTTMTTSTSTSTAATATSSHQSHFLSSGSENVRAEEEAKKSSSIQSSPEQKASGSGNKVESSPTIHAAKSAEDVEEAFSKAIIEEVYRLRLYTMYS